MIFIGSILLWNIFTVFHEDYEKAGVDPFKGRHFAVILPALELYFNLTLSLN